MNHIRIEREGPVAILEIARRKRFNSLDVATAQDLRKAGLQLARDREALDAVVHFDDDVPARVGRDARARGGPDALLLGRRR